MRLRPQMRITTRVAIGLLLMAGLLIGSLAYQLSHVERLQGINREVSVIKMEAARIAIGLLQGLDGVSEFAARYSVLLDPEYRTRWEEWDAAVQADLQALSLVGLSESEEAVRTRIEEGWAEYRALAPQFAEEPVALLPEVQRVLDGVRGQAEELIAVNEAVVAERAAFSAAAGDRARWVAWASAGSALVLAGILSFLLFRSISGPLRRLTRGTREIAQGRFDHRLRMSGPSELSSLARDFDRMAARLDELEDLKRDFVSHVSHELKTPLAAIQETIEILLDEIPGPLTEKQSRLLRLSRTSSHRLSSMIFDLLELSRLEAGAGNYDPGWEEASSLALSVLEEMEPVAEERHLRLSLRRRCENMQFVCDRKRMREVLANLVSNAVKFSPEGGTVRMAIAELDTPPDSMPKGQEKLRGEHGPFFLFSVQDEGPGIPDEHKEGVFEKFHQISPGERHRGQGVGLGLAIARRIAEAHGGTIWVEDAPGRGAIFRVLVPRVPFEWEPAFDAPPGPEGDGSTLQTSPEPALGVGRPSRVAMGVVSLLFLAGCATGMVEADVTPESESTPEVEEEERSPPPAVEPPTEVGFSPAQLRLSTAWSFLAGGDYEDAYEQFQSVIEEEDLPDVRGEAVWGMALVHLLPQSPLRDPEWAGTLLDYLQRQYPDRPLGIQAAWAQGMLDDLDEVRGMVTEQEEALQQLTDTVDRLRSIDLNRSPVRSRPTRTDSLPDSILDP